MIDLGLNGKRAVVSGAGYRPERAGHGRMTSLRLADAGATVACVDIIGGARWDKVDDFTDEDWQWTIQNNLTQVFFLFQEVGRRMIRQATGGSIVAIASVDGTTASAYHVAYGAAKAGVISLARTFADELGEYGIRVNAVAPGNVGTGNEDQPEGQWAVDTTNPLAAPRSRDIANAVLFLSSELAARITGQALIVDGGTTIRSLWGMTPEVIDRFRGF